MWTPFVDLLGTLLFSLSHVCGGSLGGGIVVLSLIVRLAMLPLTLRLAIRTLEHQAILKRLAPQIEALQKQHARDRVRLAEKLQALYAANGVGVAPKGSLLTALVQLPVGVGLYQAIASGVRRAAGFLWIGDLARPDAIVAGLAAAAAGAAIVAAPDGSPQTRTAAIVSTALTFFLAWRLSARVGLYWLTSNVVGVGQSLLLRRVAANGAATRQS
jgi:YidC/Oxa1 family membrane protein insertase